MYPIAVRSTRIQRLFVRLGWARGRAAVSDDLLHQGRQRALRWWVEQEDGPARCDLCGRGVGVGEGYIVSAALVDQWDPSTHEDDEDKPWLLCLDCMTERKSQKGSDG